MTLDSTLSREKSPTFLFRPPRKWTAEHVKLAKVQVIENVDPNRLAEEFCQPTRDDLENNGGYSHPLAEENMFSLVFDEIVDYIELLQSRTSDTPEYLYSLCFREIICTILRKMKSTRGKLLYSRTSFPIKIPQLPSVVKLQNYDTIVKCIRNNTYSNPLLFPSTVEVSYNVETQMARHEIPQCLLQTMLAYSQNPNLPQYTAFALCLHKTTIQITKATISQNYLKDFFQKDEINESMQLYRSRSFELPERDGCKEFLRLIMGVFRYLIEM